LNKFTKSEFIGKVSAGRAQNSYPLGVGGGEGCGLQVARDALEHFRNPYRLFSIAAWIRLTQIPKMPAQLLFFMVRYGRKIICKQPGSASSIDLAKSGDIVSSPDRIELPDQECLDFRILQLWFRCKGAA
jgi:hypothetical protein